MPRPGIDVFCGANEAVEDNREAADQDVLDTFRVQCVAEREGGLRAQVRVSIRDHADHLLGSERITIAMSEY